MSISISLLVVLFLSKVIHITGISFEVFYEKLGLKL